MTVDSCGKWTMRAEPSATRSKAAQIEKAPRVYPHWCLVFISLYLTVAFSKCSLGGNPDLPEYIRFVSL